MTRVLVSIGGVLVWIASSTIVPVPGVAQTGEGAAEQDVARARELFSEGVALADEAQWSAAAEKFRAALALHPAPTIEYNLASALIELREYQEADAHLTSMIDNPETPADFRQTAIQARADIRARAAEIRIQHTGAGTVRVDGREVPPERVHGSYFVEPGPHTVELERDGVVVARTEVRAEAGLVTTAELESDEEGSVASDGGGLSASAGAWIAVVGIAAAVLTIGILVGLTSTGNSGGSGIGNLGPDVEWPGGPAISF
jgi:hypothetical protein